MWDEVLENVFPDEVDGIDCVLETETKVYTYHVTDGVATFKGEGDLHSSEYDKYRHRISLTGEGLFGSGSASYTLSLYPTKELFEVYHTPNPMIASIGSVCIIFFTSILFFLYDFYVRKEFSAKKELLEAKRKFVRFVSHEVRTPLNSVCMGLTLMQEDIGSALGFQNNQGSVAMQQRIPENKLYLKGEERKHTVDWLNLADEILINAQSAVDVLNDLLNYDKVEMGQLSLELTVVSIWNLIESTAKEFKLSATKKKISYSVEFDQTLSDPENGLNSEQLPQEVKECKVVGDTVRISQVLRNLLSNGVKFTPEGGKKICFGVICSLVF